MEGLKIRPKISAVRQSIETHGYVCSWSYDYKLANNKQQTMAAGFHSLFKNTQSPRVSMSSTSLSSSISSLSSTSLSSARKSNDQDSSGRWNVLDFSVANQVKKRLESLNVTDIEFLEAMKEKMEVHPVSFEDNSKVQALQEELKTLVNGISDDTVEEAHNLNMKYEAARLNLTRKQAEFLLVETCNKQALQRLNLEKNTTPIMI